MNSNPSVDGQVTFGPFVFNPQSGELWNEEGAAVKLQPQPTRLLALLIERAGQRVDRQEIRQHLWGDTEIDAESGVNFAIRRIRQALGESAEQPRYIETIPRRGYRFVAPLAASRPRKEEEPPEEPLLRVSEPPQPWRPVLALSVFGVLLVLMTILVRWPVGAGVEAGQARAKAASAQPVNRAAQDAYLRGLYLLQHGDAEDLPKAADFFRRALEADTGFAPAYVSLEAATRNAMGAEERTSLLERAEQLDPTLPGVHVGLGWLELMHGRNAEAAHKAFNLAHRLDPDFAEALHGAALANAILGRLDTAVELVEQALILDPAGTSIYGDAGTILFWADRPEQGLVQFHRALELEPERIDLRWSALTYSVRSGRLRQAAEQVRSLVPEDHPLANLGEGPAAWQKAVQGFLEEMTEFYLDAAQSEPHAGCLAEIYVVLGELGPSMYWLERAEQEDWYGLAYLGVDPRWDGLRQNPKFMSLLHRLGVVDYRA